MPQLDTYSQGSVALNASSTLVTGTGTGWRDAAGVVQQVHLGDWFVLGTFASLILEVLSPTQLRLATVYSGPAVSGASYDIVRYTQLATPALIAFMQRERQRGGPQAPFVRLDVDTGNVRISLRDGGDGKAGIHVGAAATADADQPRALGFDLAGNAELGGVGGLVLPAGTTAQRAAGEGRMRRNTQTKRAEILLDGVWQTLAHRSGDVHEGDIAGDVVAPNIIRTGGNPAGGDTVGGVALRPGDATRPGQVEWRTKDGVRRSYLGSGDGSAPRLLWQMENGWGAQLNGPFAFGQRPSFAGQVPFDAGNLGFATPEMSNANAGTGGDDRLAIQMAISTGKHVWLDPSKEYRTSAPLYVDGTSGQHITGGILRPSGNFNAIVVRGAKGLILDVAMRCAGMSGGYAVEFRQNSERCNVRRLHLLDSGYNGVHVEECNAITLDWVYAINLRGNRGIRWYGTAAKRSDILNINFGAIAALSGNTSLVGLDWDGNCNSLYVNNLHTVSCYHGLLVQNSAGGPIPMIGRLSAFATDFSYNNGIMVAAGDDLDFMQPYINGAGYQQSGTGFHGMLVNGPSVTATVRVFGGKSIGNQGHGFACNPAGSLFVHGSRSYSNTESNGFQLHPSSLLL